MTDRKDLPRAWRIRTLLVAALAATALAGCNTRQAAAPKVEAPVDPKAGWYAGKMADGPHEVPTVNRAKMRPELVRQTVPYSGRERPGSVVVDVDRRLLYLVQEGGTARRYGVGVGQDGFAWAGTNTISMKREWPAWRPPAPMLKRKPELPRHMEGGPDNPLGARALYLGSTLFRIHGTNEPWTIGEKASSGCIRLLNEDVIDLYERVPVGATVVVKRSGGGTPAQAGPLELSAAVDKPDKAVN
jgi:lipoprotein-anchoring transpeptidase ErfK/SrfK